MSPKPGLKIGIQLISRKYHRSLIHKIVSKWKTIFKYVYNLLVETISVHINIIDFQLYTI